MDEEVNVQILTSGDMVDCSNVSQGRGGEKGAYGHAYAATVNSEPCMPLKMVTHSWRNKFSFLLAAILADALNSEKYDQIAQLLAERQLGKIVRALQKAGKLDAAYWICAFSVNQHTGICATPPATDSTGHAITPCCCATPKHFDGDLSEMNKFDDMMAYLKTYLRGHGQARLEQVVALEQDFTLLTRVWCVAELVEAHELHLQQALKIHSSASRDQCLDRLVSLDVRKAEASFPADKELVLGKITDVDGFNKDLQQLMLHRLEGFLHAEQVKTFATLLDEVVLAVISVAI
ncbi:SYT4 [Symbiodinium necroappetens]|uniref:SYT4 protein n=1 Tax=Symbiodinium necroappetens TaxID=1628268 RepID=A0A813ANF9_9DINO|nr:SYT4 [Symbiodinium necroappetens]